MDAHSPRKYLFNTLDDGEDDFEDDTIGDLEYYEASESDSQAQRSPWLEGVRINHPWDLETTRQTHGLHGENLGSVRLSPSLLDSYILQFAPRTSNRLGTKGRQAPQEL